MKICNCAGPINGRHMQTILTHTHSELNAFHNKRIFSHSFYPVIIMIMINTSHPFSYLLLGTVTYTQHDTAH